MTQLFTTVLVAALAAPLAAQTGTAFTYQGRLMQAGSPANGLFSMTFSLFDVPTGGASLGQQTINSVMVANGLFTVQLNNSGEFGPDAFYGDERWLQIRVNATTLVPRQPVTATPYALFALNADIPVPLTLSGTSPTHIIRAENVAGSTDAVAVYGLSTAGNGVTYAGRFDNNSTSGYGVIGLATAANGSTYGVFGRSASTDGFGVYGEATSISMGGTGVFGRSSGPFGNGVFGISSSGTGVYGLCDAVSGFTYGVVGWADSPNGTGVYGVATADTGTNNGVIGQTDSPSGNGVFGLALPTSGVSNGVYGQSNSQSGQGVHGFATASLGSGWGVLGRSSSVNGLGVSGIALSTSGVNYGVYGQSISPNGRGVYGEALSSTGTTFGVLGYAPNGSGWGVYAVGNLGATGVKAFRIDHPDDPANKYLLHYSAESPEVINFYSGNAILDGAGEAVVELPHYFAKINKDPRYQLTAVGSPMPKLHVAEEIDEAALIDGADAGPEENAPICWFRIAGGAPGAKVSWRVEAVRNDRWVQQRGAPVEVEKEGLEKGTYQHPELYGQPPEMGMNYQPELERVAPELERVAPEPTLPRTPLEAAPLMNRNPNDSYEENKT